MTACGKYQIIEVDTLEARKRHRILIEEALKAQNLTPYQRADLELQLKKSLIEEADAQNEIESSLDENDADEEEGEGDKEKKKGGSTDSSGQQGGTGESTTTNTEDQYDDTLAASEDFSDLDLLELLFFYSELGITSDSDSDYDLQDAFAAATLAYDKDEQIVQIQEPYGVEDQNNTHSPTHLLPTLEHHIVGKGVREIHVTVHPDAVELFKRKFGYEPVGKAQSNTMALQRMRKILTNCPN